MTIIHASTHTFTDTSCAGRLARGRGAARRVIVGTLGEHRLSTEKAIKTFIITGKIPHTLSRADTKTWMLSQPRGRILWHSTNIKCVIW